MVAFIVYDLQSYLLIIIFHKVGKVFLLNNFINLFLALLGLHFSAGLFSSCSAQASHCGGCSCCGAGTLGLSGFSKGTWVGSCGS